MGTGRSVLESTLLWVRRLWKAVSTHRSDTQGEERTQQTMSNYTRLHIPQATRVLAFQL